MASRSSLRCSQSSINWVSLGLESLGLITEKLQLIGLWGFFSNLIAYGGLIVLCVPLVAL